MNESCHDLARCVAGLLLSALVLPLATARAEDPMKEIARASEALTRAQAEGRLRQLRRIAAEMDDPNAVLMVEDEGSSLLLHLEAGRKREAELGLRNLERRVGLDPGGRTVAGLPLFLPEPRMLEALEKRKSDLQEALDAKDEARVHDVVGEMVKILGDRAGVPDFRRRGQRGPLHRVSKRENSRLFLGALDGEREYLKGVEKGKASGEAMLREYAGLVRGCCLIRPLVEKHDPLRLERLDRLVAGASSILLGLQQPAGHFPFPDLRGKHARFGPAIEKMVKADPEAVKDGWVVAVDPNGGTQFDTGECGAALLLAGELYGKKEWTEAGIRASDWALKQPCVPNWNYNAFSVHLLTRASGVSKEERYLDGAVEKFLLGVAPGQTRGGRWFDPHNARTVYHLILLRAAHDVVETLASLKDTPAFTGLRKRAHERGVEVSWRAMHVVVEELDLLGLTAKGHVLQELLRFRDLYPDAEAENRDVLRKAMDEATAGIFALCIAGRILHLGVAPDELASLHRAWE